ncbi:MAG: hypothetical protein K2L28_07185 [Muribaculaceae bacterium]|nr:hypothetical protein [Muribaculaceae bacterium]
MADYKRKSSGLWAWIVIGLIVAALVVATLYYIGWFDANSHVDTPAGDNVEEQYRITVAGADQPGEADWQNADGQSLREVIADPEAETSTPPQP